MESFLVYLFNFYYAISELEQNKQNNTIIFFLLFIFLTKKWTSAVCGGVRAHPSHPPSLRAWVGEPRKTGERGFENVCYAGQATSASVSKVPSLCEKLFVHCM